MTFYGDMLGGSRYKDLDDKAQERLRLGAHYEKAFNTLISMFDYGGLPDTLDKAYMELLLLTHGQAFICRAGGDIVAARGTLGGELDAYGRGTECICTTLNGKEATGARNVGIAWVKNNSLASGEDFIKWYAAMQSDVDRSLELNVLYARYLPVPVVRDDKTKAAFERFFKDLMDGRMTAVLSDNMINNELGVEENIIDITDVNRIDKTQYLSRLHDDLDKQFYNRYGQALQTQNKSAQQTSDEIHGMDSASFIIPLDMLKARQEGVEQANRIFGTSITVDFSEAWRYELERYRNTYANETSGTDRTSGTNETDGTNETTGTNGTDGTNEASRKGAADNA